MPSAPPQYDCPAFWDKRYKKSPEVFEWYRDYQTLRPLLRAIIPLNADVLQIGVGTSNLQADMAADGYTSILSQDISQVAIDVLTARDRDKPALTYIRADCRSMPEIASCSADFVLDKGTLDALMCGSQAPRDVANTLQEAFRVLRSGGSYLIMSYGSPANRIPYLSSEAFPFSITVYVIGKPPPPSEPDEPEADCFLKGPFYLADPVQEQQLLALNTIDDNLHWVYICQKPPKPPPEQAAS